MNNQQLIESLDYHISIFEEKSKSNILKKIKDKMKNNYEASKKYNKQHPYSQPVSIGAGLGLGKGLYNAHQEANITKGLFGKPRVSASLSRKIVHGGRGALIGAAAGYGAKKAYDHFKNKKK